MKQMVARLACCLLNRSDDGKDSSLMMHGAKNKRCHRFWSPFCQVRYQIERQGEMGVEFFRFSVYVEWVRHVIDGFHPDEPTTRFD